MRAARPRRDNFRLGACTYSVSENDTMLAARAWRGMLGSIARGHGTVVLSRDSNTVWILETGHRLHGPAGATV